MEGPDLFWPILGFVSGFIAGCGVCLIASYREDTKHRAYQSEHDWRLG